MTMAADAASNDHPPDDPPSPSAPAQVEDDSLMHAPDGTRPIVVDEHYRRLRFRLKGLVMLSLALGLVVVALSVYTYRSDSVEYTSGVVGTGKLAWKPLPDDSQVLTRIAFGSCQKQSVPQPYWDTLIDLAPDLVVQMGDNVYGDCHEDLPGDPCQPLRQAYRDQASHASQQGAASRLSIFPTLDDHDYGQNDCHAENPYKETARQLFADFYDIDIASLPDDGVYRSASFGPVGKRLQVILLDTRYNRSPFVPSGLNDPSSRYIPVTDPSVVQSMLGDRQWTWLQERLEEPADLRLVVSSIQVLDTVAGVECWRHLPTELQKVKEVLRDKSALLLSGDRHVGGFYEHDGLVEVTASSWTHTAFVGAYGDCDSVESCDEEDEARIGDFVRTDHFGTVEVDWENRNLTVALRKAASSPGATYLYGYEGDAGDVIDERSYTFDAL